MIDKPRFMADFLRISTKDEDDTSGNPGLIVPLVPNKLQKYYLENRTPRNCILKARQMGSSTIILADFFIDVISIVGLAANVVSYGDVPTSKLLKKVQMFYDLCPRKNFFPMINHDTDHLVSFPRMNSSFFIGTSRASVLGRGETIHRCHLSEFASYNKSNPGRAEEIIAEVGQSVPMKTGVLTIESTPYSRGDAFYNIYFGAKSHENNFHAFFFPWWWAGDYFILDNDVQETHQEDRESNLELTDEEVFLCEMNHLTHDQLRWRRYKIRELGKKFFREYPEDDQSCWLNPESMIFDRPAIDRNLRMKVPQLEFRPAEQLTVWQLPEPCLYVIGVDPASGLARGDWSTASIIRADNGMEVAAIRGKFPVDTFSTILAQVGKEYNYALIGVENSGHGVAVLKYLENMGYPNIYCSYTDEGKMKAVGWTTSATSRPKMIDDFDTALRSGAFRTSNEQLLNECLGFLMIDGKPQAEEGGTDDALFAAMIGWGIRGMANAVVSPHIPAESYLPY